MSYRVLIAEDDESTRFLIEQYCKNEPLSLIFVADGILAMQQLRETHFDLVVTDIRLPGISGEELLNFVHETQPETPVIVITGYGSIDGAVNFLRRGAFDYIPKPFTGEVFTHRLLLAIKNLDLRHEVDRLRGLQSSSALDLIKTVDPKMTKILSRLPSIAKTDASVVFTGESGTGKELFSKALHDLSNRAKKPFVSVSCAALPETLIESELFGHLKGAFTDAHANRRGLIEEAEGGTLFLDEVGELPLTVQAKLLRFLQEREFKPVGGNEIKHADVRIVAATHRNLEQEVKAGRFREDLFYRLNVVPIHIPPLRERLGDIPLLAKYWLKRFATEFGRPQAELAPEVLERLSGHTWLGNVRELMNRVQRMVVMADESFVTLEVWNKTSNVLEDKSPMAPNTLGGFAAEKRAVLDKFEQDFIRRCLSEAGGNVAKAARLAQLDRKNFWSLMKRHNLVAQDFRLQAAGGGMVD